MNNPPDEIALLEAAVDHFTEQPVPEDGSALATYLKRVQRVIDRLAVKSSHAAAAFAETDEFDHQGFVSPIHWIRLNCHMTGGAAADRVAVGQQLQSVPESHQSLLEGEIVWTSGATEGNNLAIKGAAQFYKTKGRHLITQKTEHKAVLDTCKRLEKYGYRVTYLPVQKDGLVDLDDLPEYLETKANDQPARDPASRRHCRSCRRRPTRPARR